MREYLIWLAKTVTLVVLVLFIVPLALVSFVAAIGTVVKSEGSKKNMVAVVELKGEISTAKEVIDALNEQIENESTKGIVLAIDSPGGTVGAAQEIYGAVQRLKAKKPIVAVMQNVAASGGLYAALGASKILCQPGTLTGSIGVIMQIPNFKKVADWAGFSMMTMKSGEMKDVGNSFREMSQGERDFLQGLLATVHDEFINTVARSRNLPRDEVVRWADGRIIVGTQAKDYHLVDGFGDVYAGGRAVFELLGQPLPEGEDPGLFYSHDSFDQLRKALKTVSSLPSVLHPHAQPMLLMP